MASPRPWAAHTPQPAPPVPHPAPPPGPQRPPHKGSLMFCHGRARPFQERVWEGLGWSGGLDSVIPHGNISMRCRATPGAGSHGVGPGGAASFSTHGQRALAGRGRAHPGSAGQQPRTLHAGRPVSLRAQPVVTHPLWLGPLWPFSLESSLGPQGRLPHPVPCTRRLTVPSDLHAPTFASSRPPLHTSSSGRQPCAPPGAAQPPKAPAPSPPSVEPFPPCEVLHGPLSCAMRPCGQAPSLNLIQSCPLPLLGT